MGERIGDLRDKLENEWSLRGRERVRFKGHIKRTLAPLRINTFCVFVARERAHVRLCVPAKVFASAKYEIKRRASFRHVIMSTGTFGDTCNEMLKFAFR